MSLRRPTVALSLFTFDISPLCDVAQTSDCGTHCHLYSIISPLCGVALTPDCGIVILVFSSRGVIQTLVWPSVFTLGFREDYRPTSLLFPMHYYFYVWVHLLICSYASCLHLLYLMSELSCEYFHSTHLACWFGQMLMKAITWMKSLIARPTPRGVPVSPARSRILVTCFVYASATRNKSPRASLRRSKSCSFQESYHPLRGDISTTVVIVS